MVGEDLGSGLAVAGFEAGFLVAEVAEGVLLSGTAAFFALASSAGFLAGVLVLGTAGFLGEVERSGAFLGSAAGFPAAEAGFLVAAAVVRLVGRADDGAFFAAPVSGFLGSLLGVGPSGAGKPIGWPQSFRGLKESGSSFSSESLSVMSG